MINKEAFKNACQCLIDNGIEADEAETVCQAIAYILTDEEPIDIDSGDEDTTYCAKFHEVSYGVVNGIHADSVNEAKEYAEDAVSSGFGDYYGNITFVIDEITKESK